MKASFTIILSLCVLLFGAVPALAADEASPTGKPTIFVCGDSTAKNNAKNKEGKQMAGWGTPIANYFDPAKVTVSNVGHAGQSSMSYYAKDWPSVLPKINKGDFVLLVFGINDGGTPAGMGDETKTGKDGTEQHTYGWYMSKMATDAQEKGAQVYFLTVTTRNIWTNPKTTFKAATPVGDLPADYDPKADKIERGTAGGRMTQTTKDVAAKIGRPVFDLTNFCADLYEKMGREEVNKLYSDHNHTYPEGADIVASCIVSGLKAFKDSPFVPLLSDKGKAVVPADAKYVSDNIPAATK